ncbi:MAG: L-seryl-tRNA(Sec) selenium transferase, partial [Chloroflexota bacterium]|nr:L-seryl-tRNA(Sec) selenium transferase [Chloroflexota bacterium]
MATSGSPDRERRAESAAFRVLPPVADLVRSGREVDPRLDERALTGLVQDYLSRTRQRIGNGERPSRDDIDRELRREVARLATPRLAPALNATGVVIHTNLGRAPVSREA